MSEISNSDNNDDEFVIVKLKKIEIDIFSSDEFEQLKLKKILELANNDNAKKIIRYLQDHEEVYLQKLAKETKIDTPLVYRQLVKLDQVGFIDITRKKINKHTKIHKFFSINSRIIVVLKFGIIGLMGFTTWNSFRENSFAPTPNILSDVLKNMDAHVTNELFYVLLGIFSITFCLILLISIKERKRFYFVIR